MTTELQQVLESIAEFRKDVDTKLNEFDTKLNAFDTKLNNYNEKFDNYQKASQAVVNLAFSLIASATIITVIGSIFHR